MAGAPVLRHAPAAEGGEFVLEQDGRRVGELTYDLAGKRLVIRHTGVEPSLRGHGAARQLLDAAIAFARAQDYKVIPRCSYASVVFARTPAAFADILAD